jgi:hypothetical protein
MVSFLTQTWYSYSLWQTILLTGVNSLADSEPWRLRAPRTQRTVA